MLEHLRPMAIFAKTIELGSFRAAASALHLSPSVISHHITSLEQQLGVVLLYRSTRQLSLTTEGQLLYDAACRMTAAAEEALDAVATRTGQPIGELRITAPATLALSRFPDDMAAFSAAYPKIVLDLSFSDVRQDLIGDGIDIAVRMALRPLADSTLKVRKLYEIPRLLVASRAYAARMVAPVCPQDLVEWDWLRLAPLPNAARLQNADREPEDVAFKPRLVADSGIALYQLAKAGLGLAMVPDFLALNDIESGAMVNVLPAWQPERAMVLLVSPANTARDSVTSYFVAFMDRLSKS